ncbi:GH3 auxin-responsive promoter family protein [Anaerosporobacter faecicola]|uniref:GH3 auxin-responsive promoter family protein n=1 Tax=Anaerosporobacter faecicola TaxID=2718714 RepID=UPI00143AEB51|nr:GH3 auxin-responsive promoter family protein [Anaerosporobacter faecicola]
MTESLHDLYLQIISEGTIHKNAFDEIANNPGEYNKNLLSRILTQNKDTEFGKRYNFDSISNFEQYKKQVPITHYVDYEPDLTKMIQEGTTNLITSEPIHHFMESSGTQGKAKYLPLTDGAKEIIHTLSKQLFSRICDLIGDNWTYNKLLLLIVPAERTLSAHADRNSLSTEMFIGIFEEHIEQFVVSPMVAYEKGKLTDTQYLHAFYSLSNPDMCSIFSPFMSFILEFFHYVDAHKEDLLKAIEEGVIDPSLQLSEADYALLAEQIKPNKARADELRAIFEQYPKNWPSKVWPKLELIISTGSGSFLECTKVVRHYIGPTVNIMGLGFGASECVFSMPVTMNDNDAVLLPHTGFYEFLPLGEEDYSKTCTLEDLEVGKSYEILVTTISGLYRYQMRDAITVTGYYKNTPKILFSHRIDQTINIFGEKTSELLLRKIAYDTADSYHLSIHNFSVYPDTTNAPMRYVFFIEFTEKTLPVSKETIEQTLEENLRKANFLYAFFSDSGKLGALKLHILLKGSYVNYKQSLLQEGKNISQIKPVRIISSSKIKDFFYHHIDPHYEDFAL